MTLRKTLFLSVAFLALVLPGAHANDLSVRQALQNQYAKWVAAYRKGDTGFFFTLMTDNYMQVDTNGRKRNRTQQLALLRKGMAASRGGIHSFTMKITHLAVHGNSAVADIALRMEGTTQDLKRPHHAIIDGTARNFWVKLASGWQIQRSETLSHKRVIDGKVVQSSVKK